MCVCVCCFGMVYSFRDFVIVCVCVSVCYVYVSVRVGACV